MRAGVLHPGWFEFVRPVDARDHERPFVVERTRPRTAVWDPSRFANEQIRNLARRVFDESASPPRRQVVFTSIDPDVEIHSLCERVASSLASETAKSVAVITHQPGDRFSPAHADAPSRKTALSLQTNVWLLSMGENNEQRSGTGSLYRYLENVRREFEYSIVAAQPGALNAAVAAARVADGAVLVVSAIRTRRASATRFLSAFAQVHMLGTVLIDREFPMPDAIYRRL